MRSEIESGNKAGDSGSSCWVPSQDLIIESPWEINMAGCTPSVSTYKIQGVFQKLKNFLQHDLTVIEMKVFSKSILRFTIFSGWGFSIRQRKTFEAISVPFRCLHLLDDFRILLDVIRSYGNQHNLRTIGGNYSRQ